MKFVSRRLSSFPACREDSIKSVPRRDQSSRYRTLDLIYKVIFRSDMEKSGREMIVVCATIMRMVFNVLKIQLFFTEISV